MKNTLVVIPAYNEEDTISELVKRSLKYADVCVVNDCSKDSTSKIVKSIKGAFCIDHEKNTHIPKTVLDGIAFGVKKKYNYIITMDAGLSHNPDELPIFINAPHSDLVIGFRQNKVNVPLYRKFLSFSATLLFNFALRPIYSRLPKAKFKDATSGFRRYSRKAAELLVTKKFMAKTFDFHVEALMFVYRNGLAITEVPISYNFTNSSFRMKILLDEISMLLNLLFSRRK